MTARALTQGAHHIGLTVSDLSQTQSFFIESLGFEQVGEVPDYPAVFLNDGTVMIALWQAKDPGTAIPFDRKNIVGLHHLALKVQSVAALDKLYRSLSETHGIEIEFAPEPLGGGPTKHMMISIPGGIRMELIALAA